MRMSDDAALRVVLFFSQSLESDAVAWSVVLFMDRRVAVLACMSLAFGGGGRGAPLLLVT